MFSGLSSSEATARLKQYGLNEIEEKQVNPLIKFLKWFVRPTSVMIEVALILSVATQRLDDAYVIFFLLMMNNVISFIHEFKADDAIKKLREHLEIKTKVIRDGQIVKINSKFIVPDDIVVLNTGDIVPADSDILESSDLSVDESMLTGESLPKDKKDKDKIFSGSIIRTGKCFAKVNATGNRTYYGKTVKLVEGKEKESLIEKDVIRLTKLLIVIGLASMAILAFYFLYAHRPLLEIITLLITVAIASFPIALPTVITLVTSIGVLNLSKKSVVIRRLASLEDFSNTDLLLTDKTGTLTKNKISVDDVVEYSESKEWILNLALACSDSTLQDPIDDAVIAKAEGLEHKKEFKVLKYVPANSATKFSLSDVSFETREMEIIKGAPQTIRDKCALDAKEKEEYDRKIEQLSSDGYRVIAVAYKYGQHYKLAGLLLLLDPLHDDAKDTVDFMRENKITTKMVTGDNFFIARKISQLVGLGKRVIARSQIETINPQLVEDYDAFAEVLPEDKFDLVNVAKQNHIVAVTGDGVNDIPAIKDANVGIAVSTATDATKGAADAVLLSSGISVIKDALMESRKLIEKIYYYGIYRISESFRVIMTVLLIGLALGNYPITPLQLILLSVLNDIPIISIAFDRVQAPKEPKKIVFKRRTSLGLLLGSVGTVSSLVFVWLALYYFHLPISQIQTAFFLKLSIGGHFLLLVARTKDRWFKFKPSNKLLLAILATQLTASMLAYSGFIIPQLPLPMILFMWAYSFIWMQISEVVKAVSKIY